MIDGEDVVDKGSRSICPECPSLVLEGLAIVHVMHRLANLGYNGLLAWYTDAKPIVQILHGSARARKPTMQFTITNITTTAQKLHFKLIPIYAKTYDCILSPTQ